MKPILLALCLFSPMALACDLSSLPLAGVASIDTCHGDGPDCLYAGQVLHDYMDAVPDSDAVLTIALQSSP